MGVPAGYTLVDSDSFESWAATTAKWSLLGCAQGSPGHSGSFCLDVSAGAGGAAAPFARYDPADPPDDFYVDVWMRKAAMYLGDTIQFVDSGSGSFWLLGDSYPDGSVGLRLMNGAVNVTTGPGVFGAGSWYRHTIGVQAALDRVTYQINDVQVLDLTGAADLAGRVAEHIDLSIFGTSSFYDDWTLWVPTTSTGGGGWTVGFLS